MCVSHVKKHYYRGMKQRCPSLAGGDDDDDDDDDDDKFWKKKNL
jgi:hypothetical protein